MLTDRETRCLFAWRGKPEEWDVLSFKEIARQSGLDLSVIRRTVRSLARKGLTVFARGCLDEDGKAAGSGYGLTDVGREALNARQ